MTTASTSDPTSLLVVEDSRMQAQILSQKLRAAGYDVRVAENGQVALDLIHEQRPTLIISDIEMPKMTGYELCSAVKSDAELKRIPFILLSTLADAQDIIKGLHCGADNYVTKPYDPDFLLGRVESLLATPLANGEQEEQQLDVTLGGTHYTVKAGRQQVLNLLISTFENAVEKNNELLRSNEELTIAKEQLTHSNQQLESLNERLETTNQRMKRDLDAAAKVQQSLLPAEDPETSAVRVAWEYLPCDELAGDFLNCFMIDEQHLAMFVVDVSGHGVASSLLAVAIGRTLTPQASSSSLLIQPDGDAMRVAPPAEVAGELNRRFPMDDQNGLYFTMAYGVLNVETLLFRFVSAGHDPIVYVPHGGKPQFCEGKGTPIGWFEDMEYDEHTLQLQAGDRLYLYSDGVPEAMNGDLEQFSMQQMLEIMELGASQDLDEAVGLLLRSVKRWCVKSGPKDDVSILGIQVSS